MSEFIIVSLILLGIVALDSAGDAFRANSRQNVHHLMETLGVGAWIAIWALFEFKPIYVGMYVTGRIWLFDPLFNIISVNELTYIGTSSVYGRILTWFTSIVREPGHLTWVIRAIALMFWLGWLLSR
jgi:hypothetical protein